MTLYVVPVPIGNLKDITLRAIDILKKVDFVITEDTTYSLKLLNHLGIKKKLLSYFRHQEARKADRILDRLEGQDGALISDCGTPLISDPGFILIKKAIERGIPVVALPGPTAFVPALVLSGINPESFMFLGFPPRKQNELETYL
jgi:16S rRNA (cytidine1402-2'-O)-methyltransferase